jgi:hypothetical protein
VNGICRSFYDRHCGYKLPVLTSCQKQNVPGKFYSVCCVSLKTDLIKPSESGRAYKRNQIDEQSTSMGSKEEDLNFEISELQTNNTRQEYLYGA